VTTREQEVRMSDQVVEHHDVSTPDEGRQGDRFRAGIVDLSHGPVARPQPWSR
jgi:hypothetical protein